MLPHKVKKYIMNLDTLPKKVYILRRNTSKGNFEKKGGKRNVQ